MVCGNFESRMDDDGLFPGKPQSRMDDDGLFPGKSQSRMDDDGLFHGTLQSKIWMIYGYPHDLGNLRISQEGKNQTSPCKGKQSSKWRKFHCSPATLPMFYGECCPSLIAQVSVYTNNFYSVVPAKVPVFCGWIANSLFGWFASSLSQLKMIIN